MGLLKLRHESRRGVASVPSVHPEKPLRFAGRADEVREAVAAIRRPVHGPIDVFPGEPVGVLRVDYDVETITAGRLDHLRAAGRDERVPIVLETTPHRRALTKLPGTAVVILPGPKGRVVSGPSSSR